MQALRSLLWVTLFFLGVLGVLIPALYLYAGSGLPQLDSEYDVEKLMRLTVEGERMSFKLGMTDLAQRQTIPFEKPEFSRLPKDLVAVYISQLDCPAFFRNPLESSPLFAWRTFRYFVDHSELPGDGACELYILLQLVNRMGISPGSRMERAVALHKLRSVLQKDQMVAYELSSIDFDRAVMGVSDAAEVVFAKPLEQLSLAEMAEFALAFPNNGYWAELKECRNPTLLRKHRDFVLTILGRHKLASEEQVAAAKGREVGCRNAP